MTISPETLIIASEDQVSCAVGDELVLLSLKDGNYYGLNKVGADVWNALQTPKRVDELQSILRERYEVSAEECNQALLNLLNDLMLAGLAAEAGSPRFLSPDPRMPRFSLQTSYGISPRLRTPGQSAVLRKIYKQRPVLSLSPPACNACWSPWRIAEAALHGFGPTIESR